MDKGKPGRNGFLEKWFVNARRLQKFYIFETLTAGKSKTG